MANTTTAGNNKSVTYGAKVGREMTDNRDNAEHQPVDGKPPRAKTPSKRFRKAARGAMKRGLISEKAAKRHLGGV